MMVDVESEAGLGGTQNDEPKSNSEQEGNDSQEENTSSSNEEKSEDENGEAEIPGEASGAESSEDDGDGEQHASSAGKGFGMSEVISKLLEQPVSKPNPILAKRKTKMMKDREAQAQERRELAQRQLANKEKKTKGLIAPDPLQAPYERQLKKVATRGVVALFNAIAKHQRGATEGEEGKEGEEGGVKKKGDAKTASKAGFLEMLKGSNSAGKEQKNNTSKATNDGSDDEQVKPKWKALDDNFLLAKKGWDQESGSEEEGESAEDSGIDEEAIDFSASDDDEGDGRDRARAAIKKRGGGGGGRGNNKRGKRRR